MTLLKCCTQYASKFGKLSSGHRTGKSQFSFQSQRKTMPKNAQTAAQLHSSHTLVKWCSKLSKPGFSNNVNREIPDVQAGFRKGRGTRDQIANIHWIIKKAREFQKNIYFCFIDYSKDWLCGSQQTVKFLDTGIADHLICLQRNLYAGQEATVRTGHGTTYWFQIVKGVGQSCISFNSYAEFIMQYVGLNETQAGIKIARRNINNLRYTNDTTLMAEREEELKSPLRAKEEGEKAGLKFNI